MNLFSRYFDIKFRSLVCWEVLAVRMSAVIRSAGVSSSDPRPDLSGGSGLHRPLCSVCDRIYREPKLLPCLHTFCSDCIRQLEPFSVSPSSRARPAGEDRPSITVLCPDCDSEVDLPPSGPQGLTTDHLALDQVFRESLGSDGPLGCDLCGEGAAESRCELCSFNLCEFCCLAHQ